MTPPARCCASSARGKPPGRRPICCVPGSNATACREPYTPTGRTCMCACPTCRSGCGEKPRSPSSDRCAPSWGSASSPPVRRRPRDGWSACTVPIRTGWSRSCGWPQSATMTMPMLICRSITSPSTIATTRDRRPLTSGSQFRDFILAYGPAQYPHGSYRKQAIEVLHLSARLNDTAKVIAEYWADGPGSGTPPGHWNIIAQEISRGDGHTIDDDVKMFFILGNALMDASIAVWDCKRASDSIRPVSAIRFLFGGKPIRAWAGPGMGTQLIDGEHFQSYIATPPFASYISGHSTFSASGAQVLRRFKGSDNFGASFTALPGSSTVEPGVTPAQSMTLSWATFTEAADQAGVSRRYGGIHFKADDLVGRQTGRLVADVVWNKAMSYINGTSQ